MREREVESAIRTVDFEERDRVPRPARSEGEAWTDQRNACDPRRHECAARVAPPRNTVTTNDIGRLDWPVDGPLIYRFGDEETPGGGIIKRNGIAIRAEPNTPVKVVEAGTVILAGPLGTYGLIVIVSHGDGYLSLYGQLTTALVEKGAHVTKGQVIGTTGGLNTPEGAHLYFEIRGSGAITLDPSDWLRTRR